MFIHMSIHRPRADRTDDLAASMHRFGAAAADRPGLLAAHVFLDRRSGRLVGMTLWQSEADWRAAVELQRAAVETDPFDEWELDGPDVLQLDEV